MDETASSQIPGAVVDAAYARLRAIAQGMMVRERANHTLEPTALVNEALGRLLKAEGYDLQDSDQLSRLVTVMMRRILVDYARSASARRSRERQGGAPVEESSDAEQAEELLRLNRAISDLQRTAPRRAEVLEQFYFGGMTTSQIAERLEVSVRTVQIELAVGRHALQKVLRASEGAEA